MIEGLCWGFLGGSKGEEILSTFFIFYSIHQYFIIEVFLEMDGVRGIEKASELISVEIKGIRGGDDVMVDDNPVNSIVIDGVLEFVWVIRVESGGHIFIVVLRRFFPDVEGAVKDGLRETIPKKARAAIAPVVVVPAPEGVLGKVGDASMGVLLIEEIKEIKVFLRNRLAEGRRDEVTRKDGGGVDEKKKRDGKGGEEISKTVVEKREEIKDEDGTNREKDGKGKTKRKRELSKRGAEEFGKKRNEFEKKIAAKKEENGDEGDGEKRKSKTEIFFKRVIDTSENEREVEETDDGDERVV